MTGLLLTLLIGVGPSLAASPASTTVDAALTVRLPARKSTFAMGEIIPLELEFCGRAGPDYYFSTATGDRLALSRERYEVTPAGGSDDPMAELLSSVGIAGSVLSGWHPLDGSPLILRVHLNQWVRFTKPGSYRLVVQSTRLERYSREPAPTLTSGPVTLDIETAKPEWAAAEMARAVAALDGRGPLTPREGAAILQHLGTKEAALALVSHYGTGGRERHLEWLAGLVASSYRAEIVKAMEARVDAGRPLPPGFVRDLALLRSLLDSPKGSYAERFERQKAAECDYTRRSIEGLVRMKPSVADLSAALVVLEDPPDAACESSFTSLLEADPAASRDAFLALPAATQALLHEHRWTAIGGPWAQPAVEALYESWRGDSRFPGAGDAALRRLAGLTPSRGRALALEEIRTGAHGLAPDTLLSLVEDPIAGLDDALRVRYRAARSDDARAAALWLIARYGSSGLAPLVRAELERPSPCDAEAAALAYLLKHDPRTAFERLQPGFDRRRPGMCVVPPWGQIAPRYWDDRVEDALIDQLGDREPRLVVDAAQTLQSHGSARSKVALLERFARWAEECRGRGEELDASWPSRSQGPFSPDSPAIVENALVNALFENPRIALTAADMDRIRGLCVTSSCRHDVDARARSRRGP